MSNIKIFWIDLFSGAGGTTSGIHMSEADAEVVACVNHDAEAIATHKINHPDCLHLNEDIRDFRVVVKLWALVRRLRRQYPGCLINIWASLECTHFSKAKGGLSREADSRTLANHLYMYIEKLKPDYLYIENVREFLTWGPLCDLGKQITSQKCTDYNLWRDTITEFYGYQYEYQLLNSADYGAYTSRERYFGQFAKHGLPISWPKTTHTKKGSKKATLNPGLHSWKAVKEVLDLYDEGISIFQRKKDLAENTLVRILAGLVKFVAGGESAFIKKYYSSKPEGKVISLNGPAGTITTIDGQAIVQTEFAHNKDDRGNFLINYYSSGGIHSSVENPCPTILSNPKQALTSCAFIDQQYGKSKPIGVDEPVNSLTTNPKFNLVKPWIMDTNFKNVGSSVDEPNRVITANRKHHYLMNPQFNSKGSSVDAPGPTIIARQDKAPLYVVACEENEGFSVVVFDSDSETMIKIKEFMALYGIVDIKMRMLKINELLKIQGFPDDYVLTGTKTIQKKFIGNSVVPLMAQKLVESNYYSVAIQRIKAETTLTE